jgi:hypothetical protein
MEFVMLVSPHAQLEQFSTELLANVHLQEIACLEDHHQPVQPPNAQPPEFMLLKFPEIANNGM